MGPLRAVRGMAEPEGSTYLAFPIRRVERPKASTWIHSPFVSDFSPERLTGASAAEMKIF